MALSYITFLSLWRWFCPGFVYVTYCRILQSETKGPHHIHSLRSSCFIKTSAFNVAVSVAYISSKMPGKLVMVVKFTFQGVFGNSRRNPRHSSARGHEESLELRSILWSDRPTSKQKVLRHGNRFAARVRRRYFRRERSDDRKCVCCSRASLHQTWYSVRSLSQIVQTCIN